MKHDVEKKHGKDKGIVTKTNDPAETLFVFLPKEKGTHDLFHGGFNSLLIFRIELVQIGHPT